MVNFFRKTNRIFACVLCALMLLGLSWDMGKYAPKDSVEVDYSKFMEESSAEDAFEEISLDDGEGMLKYTVNNKNMGYIKGESVQTLEKGEESSYVTAVSYLNYKFLKWSDGLIEPKRKDVLESEDETKEIKAEFEYVGFPRINVTFPDVAGEIDEEYCAAAISLSNVEKQYSLDLESAKIRIRGNSSSRFEKKSYKINFSSKVNLLGLGKAEKKDWVLIANHCDQSLMRNYMAYGLSRRFEGFEVQYNCAFVDVYLNGLYNGVYLLTEQVEVGKSRVDIETEGNNDDIGFLLELDSREELGSGECILIDDLRFAIKSDFTTNGQYNYAKNYLTQCNNAIKSGKKSEIENLIDMDSLLDMYLLQEYVKNFDVGFASLFMYIKEGGGKLYFGPAWDFDISMGNDDRMNDGGYEELFAGKRCGFGIGHEWFILLMDNEWFREMAAERYSELYPIINDEISEIVRYYLTNKQELEKNFRKWDVFGKQILFEPESIRGLDTYEKHFNNLVNWLEGRNEWLMKYFNSKDFKNQGNGLFDRITDRKSYTN